MRYVPLVLIVALAGCSASSTVPPTGTSSRPAVARPSETLTHVECGDPQISQERFEQQCTDDEPLIKVAKGASFTYLDTLADGGGSTQWQVKVRRFRCYKEIPGARDAGINDYQTLKAPAGKKLCVLSATHRNAGKTPGWPDGFDALVTDKGNFAQGPEDTAADHVIAEQEADSAPTAGHANPGDVRATYNLWTIPQDATPTAVLFPMTTVVTGPKYEVALP